VGKRKHSVICMILVKCSDILYCLQLVSTFMTTWPKPNCFVILIAFVAGCEYNYEYEQIDVSYTLVCTDSLCVVGKFNHCGKLRRLL